MDLMLGLKCGYQFRPWLGLPNNEICYVPEKWKLGLQCGHHYLGHKSMTLTFCGSLLFSSHVSGMVGLIATKHKNKFHLLNARHQMWAGYNPIFTQGDFRWQRAIDLCSCKWDPPRQTSNLSKWFGYIFPFTFSQNSNMVGGPSPKLRIWRNSWRCGMHVASENVTCIVVSRKAIGLHLSFIHQEQGW